MALEPMDLSAVTLPLAGNKYYQIKLDIEIRVRGGPILFHGSMENSQSVSQIKMDRWGYKGQKMAWRNQSIE